MKLPKEVKLVEVGPRDGLQNEAQTVPTDIKIDLINRLAACGLPVVEAGAFVSARWVPQMADSAEVLEGLRPRSGTSYPVLVPNMRGMDAALDAGAEEVAIFAAASETFSQKNINAGIKESLGQFISVATRALSEGIKVRGYVSCALGCPYEGDISPADVAFVAAELSDMGCYEISLGDTTGVGTPKKVEALLRAVTKKLPVEKLAVHFHDTYGQALANILTALELGVSTVDASVGGLGGCPYAPGAGGNVATEDVLYMLQGCGVKTGVDLEELVDIAWAISRFLGREPAGKVARALKRN